MTEEELDILEKAIGLAPTNLKIVQVARRLVQREKALKQIANDPMGKMIGLGHEAPRLISEEK